MRTIALSFMMLLLSIMCSGDVFAKTLLEGCIKGFSFNPGGGQQVIEVQAFPGPCAKSCDRECSFLSRKMDGADKNSQELNADIIQQCINACRAGLHYKADIYVPSDDSVSNYSQGYFIRENVGTVQSPKILWVGPYKPAFSCDPNSDQYTKADHPIQNTDSTVTVLKGAEIAITLNASTDNKVYLCGKSKIKRTPTVSFIDPAKWNAPNTLVPPFYDKASSLCSVRFRPDILTSWTYEYLWKYSAWNPNNANCHWIARTPYYHLLPIYPKDGDEISISYTGNYAFSYERQNPSNPAYPDTTSKPWDHKYAYQTIMDKNAPSAKVDIAKFVWYKNSALQIKPASSNDLLDFNKIELVGEQARVKYSGKTSDGSTVNKDEFESVGFNSDCNPDNATNYRALGLRGCVIDKNVTYETKDDPDCEGEEATYNFAECKTTIDPGIPTYTFYGELNGYSGDHAKLGIRHPAKDTTNGSDYWAYAHPFHVGGYELTVDHAGCPHKNGERLQYAIFDPDKKSPADTFQWNDISTDVLNGKTTLRADKPGKVYLRIKPKTPANGSSADINALYTYGKFGKYSITVTKMNDSGFINTSGPIRKVVQTVYDTLFSNKRFYVTQTSVSIPQPIIEWFQYTLSDGRIVTIPIVRITYINVNIPTVKSISLVGKLFDNIIKQNKFLQIIRAFVLLYITFMGIGFMLGVIQMNQKELVNRSVKLAIVLTLISETSWEFFSKNFFDVFIFGGVQLISYVATGSLGNVLPVDQSAIQADPSLIFSTFDGVFVQIFSADVWKKIGTYMLTGLLGFVTAMLVIISLLSYAYALVKAVLIYLMSLIMIAMLIVIAPVMIPMMLFQFTKQWFDTWWQMLISFTLQPVAVFACISIFNILIAMTIYSALSATICPKCYFSIPIPTGNVCLLPWYQMLSYSSAPEGFSAFAYPSGMFISSLVLLLLVHAMIRFVEFTSTIVSGIITGDISQRGQNLAGYTGRAAVVATSGIAGGVGAASAAGSYTLAKTVKGYQAARGNSANKKPPAPKA